MNRDEQIEKIAMDLNHIICFKDNGMVARYATAEQFYNKGYRNASEAINAFSEELIKRFNDLEYQANTTRKTIKVDELREQMDWILHEVVIDTIKEFTEKYVEATNEQIH